MHWLKANNHYYKHITIANLNKFPIDEILMEENITSDNENANETFGEKEKLNPMLQHKVCFDIESFYTI